MDPKELKALLKEAKDSIKGKDYVTAMKNCKLVLKKIPDNYQANLYLGTALMDQGKWQQAIESYKRATEIDPNQVYAWQGIILTYERQGNKDHPDLLDAYKKVATHFQTDDKAKYVENTKKLANALISGNDKKGALKVVSRLTKEVGMDLDVAGIVEKILNGTKYDTRTQQENEIYREALYTLLTESPKPTDAVTKMYFTQVNRLGDYGQVIKQALAMREKWNIYSAPMEWLCRYYIEGRLDLGTLKEIGPFDTLTDKLFKLYPSSSFGHFARGKFLIDEGINMGDGFAFMAAGLESNQSFYALEILISGRLEFGDFEGALEDCLNGLAKFEKDANACKKLRLFLAEAWTWLDVQKAEEMLENIKSSVADDEKCQEKWILIKCKLYMKKLDIEGLKKSLVQAEQKNVQHWLINFYKAITSGVCDVESGADMKNVIDSHIALGLSSDEKENVQLKMEAAILLFNLKHYKESAQVLSDLTNTEVGRRRPLAWKYLGQLYSLQDDVEFASKCYKKSYKLCASGDVGALLSDTYFTLEKEQVNRELLGMATKSFTKLKSKWAWLRLGILHLHNGEANEAVTALQAAIRADINDSHVWESLADAYFLRGSYSAALNSYNRALSLGADSLYNKLKVGVVYQSLGHHDKSILTLKELLDEYPENSTPVLVELARTNSLIAKEMTMENFDTRAKSAVEESLAYSVLAILTSPKKILLPWLVIAESSLTLNNLPENRVVKVPTFLLGEDRELYLGQLNSVEAFHYKDVSMDQLRQVGVQALLECLKAVEVPDDGVQFSKNLGAYIYHQLALLYFNRARRLNGDASIELYRKALIAAKKAVGSDQGQYVYWNSLGIIAYCNEDLAQHGFIKSIENEGNNVIAWCNLGMLYLKHDKSILAHQAFNKAQSVSPLYSYCWIGQGLVADQCQPNEAPDLFRHAAHLEPSSFGVSCYSDWICRILLREVNVSLSDYWFAIVRVDALTIVNDLITRVEARTRTPQMYNMKGIITALNGFYATALESFTTALDLAQNNPVLSIPKNEMLQILLNKILMLVKLERYEDAVDAFSTIETLDTIGYTIGALTTWKMGYVEQCENLYQQLLQSLSSSSANEEDRINTTIGLGLVTNLIHGPEAACNLLLQDFMVKSPHGLLALSAVGIVNGDADFVTNVMPYLEPFQEEESVVPDIGLMKACLHIMKGNSRQGVQELLKLVRLYPLNGRLWSILSQVVFHHEFQALQSHSFRKITMTALKLATRSQSVRDNRRLSVSSASATISLCYLMNNDWKTAITVALSSIRRYPWERENWIVLACSFWYQYCETGDPKSYHKVTSLLQKELDLGHLHKRTEDWARTFLSLVETYQPK